jgi:hypothetical protein
VPLVTETVKFVAVPTQILAVDGEITQVGFGTQVSVALQGWLTQPRESVTFAVSVQLPGVVQETVRDTEPF